jgi:hypothetical protein
LDGGDLIPGRNKTFFSFSIASRSGLGSTHPLIQLVPGGGGLSLRIKQKGRETDHSPPFSAEVENDVARPPSRGTNFYVMLPN